MSYIMHAAQIGSTDLIGVTSATVNFGNGHEMLMTDGNVDVTAIFRTAAAPRISLSSHSVGSVLTAVSLLTGTQAAFNAWDAKSLPDGTKDTTGHNKYAMATARTFVRSISAAIQGLATINIEAIGYNSSGSDPLTTSVTASDLTSPSLSTEAFCLGPVSINGNAIADVQSVEIDLGISEHTQFKDSAVGVTKVHVDARSPSIRITTLDPTMLQYIAGGTTPFTGSRAIGAGTVTVKLRKRLIDGTFSVSADNILLTFAHGMINPVSTDGHRRQHTFEIKPRAGASAVIQVSTSAAA